MDHDAPEPEMLNILETFAIAGVSLRMLGRGAVIAGEAFAMLRELAAELPIADDTRGTDPQAP